MLPKKLDEEVAFSHLAALDIKLTKLTTEQVRQHQNISGVADPNGWDPAHWIRIQHPGSDGIINRIPERQKKR